jgi:uncharacterized protein
VSGAPGSFPAAAAAAAAAVRLEAKVAWLSTPAAYAPRPALVDCIETHFNYVFLTDTEAYKLKKPMQLYGVDLRGLAARERGCREELRLNLRLARDTYLGVVPLVLRDGALALGGPGPPVDWLVRMRRLGAAQMLDARLRAGTVRPSDLEAVIAHLQALDRALPGTPAQPAAPDGGAGRVARRLEEALGEVARSEFGLKAADHAPLARALRARHAELGALLAARAARIRDGHGDLRAEHVWLGPPLQVIDALDFDRELRMLDPAEDVAMLAIDTDRLDGAWTVRALRTAYERLAGDPLPAPLWRFYLALRAATRAKVALWHLDDPRQAADPSRWRTRAVEYLAQGARLLAEG